MSELNTWRNQRPLQSVREQLWRYRQALSPLAQVFDSIYERRKWGAEEGQGLYSGVGSRGRLVEEYCALIGPELTRRNIGSLVDLGCGDFHVGSFLASRVQDYTGIDVAHRVIDENRKRHTTARRRFLQADATRDRLPPADAVIIRQVLQHLNNAEVRRVLDQVVATYPVAFITEHIHVESDLRPNMDMFHGADTRVSQRSGLRIDLPPFQLRATVLGDIAYVPGEFLRTWSVEAQ